MSGLIGLTLLVISWTRYRHPIQFLTIGAVACVFLAKEAYDAESASLFWANVIILCIQVYQIGQKQKGKI